MKHNTPLQNAHFRLGFIETNYRWLINQNPQNKIKLREILHERDECLKEIARLEALEKSV